MTRRSIELLRIAEWPRLDEKALDNHVRKIYRSRCAAIEAYAQGEPVASIEAAHGIDRSTLFRMVKRAQRAHADGSIWGVSSGAFGVRSSSIGSETLFLPVSMI